MLGIQEACSSKAHVRVRSNWKTSGRETRNPINDAALAQSLIRRGFDEGRNSSTRRPANGVKRTIERMWSIGRIGEIILAPSFQRSAAISFQLSPGSGYTEARRAARYRGAAHIDMLAFVQFLEELSTDHVTLSPAEVQRMRGRFGDKTLQMGHLEEDGSMSIPVDSIFDAIQSLGSQKLQ